MTDHPVARLAVLGLTEPVDLTPPATVTEADRRLFIELLGFDAVPCEGGFQRILDGEFDGWEKMKLIARHRIAERERAAKVAQAYGESALHGERVFAREHGTNIATAIRGQMEGRNGVERSS